MPSGRLRSSLTISAAFLMVLIGCAPGTPPPSASDAARAVVSAAPAIATTAQAVMNSDQFQAALAQANAALSSVRFQTTTTPEGASGSAATRVVMQGTDGTGAFGALEPAARRAAATAALNLGAQMYPSARLELSIVGADGKVLAAGQKEAGAQPVMTEPTG